MRGVLRALSERIDSKRLAASSNIVLQHSPADTTEEPSSSITHSWIWLRISDFLRKGDIVVTDIGTSSFGFWATKLPPQVTAMTQLVWASLGWSVGAAQGAALASRDAEQDRRTILFVGDGGMQLSVQELSTMIRHKLNVTM